MSPEERRRLHPEIGTHGTALSTMDVHPKQSSAGVRIVSTAVCVCGTPRRFHDIDGLTNTCHGYVEAL